MKLHPKPVRCKQRKPRWTAGWPDGSGKDRILLDGKAVATTRYGCGCCAGPESDEYNALAAQIVDALNATERKPKGARRGKEKK